MKCYICKKEKTENEMYFDYTRVSKRCNSCARSQRENRVKQNKIRRKEFVKKFNKLIGEEQ